MGEVLEKLFSLDFMQRGHCGNWDASYRVIYETANLLTTIAYLVIAAILVIAFLTKERPKPADMTQREASRVRMSYAAFILACGIGHLENVVAFYVPLYHLFAVWHAVTAIVSWHAVVFTFKVRFHLMAALV